MYGFFYDPAKSEQKLIAILAQFLLETSEDDIFSQLGQTALQAKHDIRTDIRLRQCRLGESCRFPKDSFDKHPVHASVGIGFADSETESQPFTRFGFRFEQCGQSQPARRQTYRFWSARRQNNPIRGRLYQSASTG